MNIPEIKTARLTLRPLQREDAEVLHRIYQVEGVLRYFPNPNPPPLEKVQKFVENQQKHWREHGYGNWGVILQGEAAIIGWAGPQFLPETSETEVGYLLNRPYWGRGLATEAAWASLKFAFENFDLGKIIALTHPENIASQRVLEKCGMTFVDRKEYFGMEMTRYWIERAAFQQLMLQRRDDPQG